jgi:hypothetical protein
MTQLLIVMDYSNSWASEPFNMSDVRPPSQSGLANTNNRFTGPSGSFSASQTNDPATTAYSSPHNGHRSRNSIDATHGDHVLGPREPPSAITSNALPNAVGAINHQRRLSTRGVNLADALVSFSEAAVHTSSQPLYNEDSYQDQSYGPESVAGEKIDPVWHSSTTLGSSVGAAPNNETRGRYRCTIDSCTKSYACAIHFILLDYYLGLKYKELLSAIFRRRQIFSNDVEFFRD